MTQGKSWKTEQTSLKTSQLQVKVMKLVKIWSVIQNQYALPIDIKQLKKKLAEVVYKSCTIISEKKIYWP